MSDSKIAASSQNRGPPCITSGSPGLDAILGDGLCARRLYLSEGSPGTYKTTLAMQFLLEGVHQAERGLYINVSETEAEVRSVASWDGWSLDGITVFEPMPPETTVDPAQELAVPQLPELQLIETAKPTLDRNSTLSPSCIILDILSEPAAADARPGRSPTPGSRLQTLLARRDCSATMIDDLSFSDDLGELPGYDGPTALLRDEPHDA